jgi:hypothetical protein
MPTRRTDSRSFEIEAFGHFQHWQFGDIAICLLTENFRQEDDVIENLASHGFLAGAHLP